MEQIQWYDTIDSLDFQGMSTYLQEIEKIEQIEDELYNLDNNNVNIQHEQTNTA